MAWEVQKVIEKLLLNDVKNPRIWRAIDELAALIGFLAAVDAQNKNLSKDFTEDFDFLINRKIDRLTEFTAETVTDLLKEYKKGKE